MRKHAFVALIIFISSILTACGGGGNTNSTVVVSTDQAFTSTTDVSSKTFYSAAAEKNTSSPVVFPSPVTYVFNSDNTASWGDPVINGTWAFNATSKIITLTESGTLTPKIITLKRNQIEADYWLVYDTSNNNRLFRLYSDQTKAQTYLTLIYKTATTYLLGGAIQGAIISSPETKTVKTLAGSDTDTPGGVVDDVSTDARFNNPTGVTTDGKGNLYVADTANHLIRKIVISTGATSTIAGVTVAGVGIAGSTDAATGTAAYFSSPKGITSDGTYLYVADTGNATIRKIDPTNSNKVTTLAGSPGVFGAIDSATSGASAQFYQPKGITTDGTNLYITDASYHTIRKVQIATVDSTSSYSKSVTTIAGSPGNLGSTDGISTAALFNGPNRITTDGTNLYVIDLNNRTIRRIVIATGATTTIAGGAGSTPESIDGPSLTTARFYFPSGITTDGTNLYITEFDNDNSKNVIRMMPISGGNVTTIAGGLSSDTPSDLTALSARFSRLLDITTNGSSIFMSNYFNGYTSTLGTVYPSYNNIRQIGP